MSNLHKNLPNDQIHDPKDFATAANSTKLTKNATGDLEWVADAGGGGVVTSLTTTGTSGASTLSGAGVLNIPIYAPDTNTQMLSRNIQAYCDISGSDEFALGNAQYNNEHKFITNLGTAAVTAITPKNMVNGSVWVVPKSLCTITSWNGWAWGAAGNSVHLSLLRAKLACPPPSEEYPASIDVCRIATQLLETTGNTTPICFNINEFTTCEGWNATLDEMDVLLLSAYVPEGKETSQIVLNCNISMTY